MKLASKIFGGSLLAACVLLAAGCSTDKENIAFSDDGALSRLETNSVVPAKDNNVSKEEEVKIELLVFSDLLTRHFWDDGDYTAIFLRADDAEAKALQAKFANRKPPIKESYRVDLLPNQSPRDKDTGKPAMILSVDMDEPDADGTVTAIGKWYAGAAVTGFYSYQLKKNGENWEIQNLP